MPLHAIGIGYCHYRCGHAAPNCCIGHIQPFSSDTAKARFDIKAKGHGNAAWHGKAATHFGKFLGGDGVTCKLQGCGTIIFKPQRFSIASVEIGCGPAWGG